MKICSRCAQENVDYAIFCENCGVELPVPPAIGGPDLPSNKPDKQVFYMQGHPPTPLPGPLILPSMPPAPTAARPPDRTDQKPPPPPPCAPLDRPGQKPVKPDDQTDYGAEDSHPHPPGLMKAGSLLLVVGVVGALIGAILPPQIDAAGLNSGIGLGPWLAGSPVPIILALAGLISGVLALLRRGFYLAVPLGVLCCFAIGPYFLTTIGAIIGTILIALNRRDFVPIIHGPPVQDKPCPVCRHPLQWVSGYREWYCFNCKSYRRLTRSHFAPGPDAPGK